VKPTSSRCVDLLVMFFRVWHHPGGSVGIVRLRAGKPKNRGSIPGMGKNSLLYSFQTSSGTHAAFYPVGTGDLVSPRVKRPGREADH
jgi:hypothetical protein